MITKCIMYNNLLKRPSLNKINYTAIAIYNLLNFVYLRRRISLQDCLSDRGGHDTHE